MSLNGSLDGFALPDVLVLLSTTKKTGELRVWGERAEGAVWLDAGQVVGAHTAECEDVVEAVVDLLRLRAGGFSFEIREPADPKPPRAMEAVLGEAQSLLDEWRKIEEVVPSLDASVRLVDDPPTPQVVVQAGLWKVLLHLAASPGASVGQLRSELRLSELAAARAVKELVDAGLARVGEEAPAAPSAASHGGAAGAADAADADDLERVWATARRMSADAPAASTPEPLGMPVNGSAAEDTPGESQAAPINRDVLLKFISSSRG